MTSNNNQSSGQSTEELIERSVKALAHWWQVSEEEARAAIMRAREHERPRIPEPRAPEHRAKLIDLTDPAQWLEANNSRRMRRVVTTGRAKVAMQSAHPTS